MAPAPAAISALALENPLGGDEARALIRGPEDPPLLESGARASQREAQTQGRVWRRYAVVASLVATALFAACALKGRQIASAVYQVRGTGAIRGATSARWSDAKSEGKWQMASVRQLTAPLEAAESEWKMTATAHEAAKWSTFRTAFWPEGDISLQSFNGRYVTWFPDGQVSAELLKPNIYTTFRVEEGVTEQTIALSTGAGKYFRVHQNGSVTADADTKTEAGSFTKTMLDDGTSSFRTFQGTYLTVTVGKSYRITAMANGLEVSDWESFHLEHISGTNFVALRCFYGKYLSAKKDGSTMMQDGAIGPSDKFEIIENDDDDTISLRTAHNTYLTAQKDGGLTARATEIGLMERWRLVNNPDNTVSLQGCHDQYIRATWSPVWVKPDQPFFWEIGIVTYAGEAQAFHDSQPHEIDEQARFAYIDGAVMLGISVERHMPGLPRVCFIPPDMREEHRHLLEGAGWHLLEVQDLEPNAAYNAATVAKINAFHVNMGLVLWMDADMFIYSNELESTLFETQLQTGQIAAVKESNDGGYLYNSGLMILKPDVETYRGMKAQMNNEQDAKGLAQTLINVHFRDNFVELDAKFNAHKNYQDAPSHSCEDVVVSHFAGPSKPSAANSTLLAQYRLGQAPEDGLDCEDFYRDYYCRLKEHASDLSQDLQQALEHTGSCIEGEEPRDVPMSGFR